MKRILLSLIMAAVLLSSLSCNHVGNQTDTSVDNLTDTSIDNLTDAQFVAGMELKSDKTRVLSDASQSDLETLVDGNSEFALDLYQQLNQENEGNIFYSPYSISLALAMTYAGARGETEQQMAEVLHFDLPQDRLHAAFNLLEAELTSRQASDDESSFQLDITNAIWGQKGFEFLTDFLDTLAEEYGAGLRIADFASATEEARQAINQWASNETEGRIEELIAKGDLDPATVLVLANAIYFKALWFSPFSEEKTHNAQFTLLDGSTVTVPMMEQVMSFGYTEGSDYQAIELKYKGHDFSMVVLLPNEGKFEEFEASLDAQKVEDIIGSLEGEAVILSMPRFSYDTGYDLKETLIEMGMPNAFGNADFSGMASNADLYIYAIGHKAFVSVDEKGTEAAAASYVGIAGLTDNEFTMDRPFIYLIRDIETGTILFIGRVVNPGS